MTTPPPPTQVLPTECPKTTQNKANFTVLKSDLPYAFDAYDFFLMINHPVTDVMAASKQILSLTVNISLVSNPTR